ncbi:hypothetical protein [Fulvivirga sp.]|uniref:hypothetical protein n=1 Tax=Fulvivirga sp. TaxID=1931237 RepID=UPI0032F001BD
MNLVLKNEFGTNSNSIDQFINRVKDSYLIFESDDLCQLGITDELQLEKAIERAQLTCSFAGLDLSWHFKAYYIDLAGELVHAWKLSKLAFILSFIKADVYDKNSADLQHIIVTKAGDLFFNGEREDIKSTLEIQSKLESMKY